MTTVKDVKDALTNNYSDDDEIIVAWWDKEWMETILDRQLTDDEWGHILRRSAKMIEHFTWGDDVQFIAEHALDAINDKA